MRPDLTPIPRPSMFGVIRKALGSILGDTLIGLGIVGGVVALFYILTIAISHYPVITIVAGLIVFFGVALTWRAFDLYEREQNELIEQEIKHGAPRILYDENEKEVIQDLITKLQFTREQAEAWVDDHSKTKP